MPAHYFVLKYVSRKLRPASSVVKHCICFVKLPSQGNRVWLIGREFFVHNKISQKAGLRFSKYSGFNSQRHLAETYCSHLSLSERVVNNIKQTWRNRPHKHWRHIVPTIRRGWRSCGSQSPTRGWRKRWKEEIESTEGKKCVRNNNQLKIHSKGIATLKDKNITFLSCFQLDILRSHICRAIIAGFEPNFLDVSKRLSVCPNSLC